MNKDEMIEEMARVLCNSKCGECVYIPRLCMYKSYCKKLYNEGYRKVADDEFVLKQGEVDEFRKDQAEVKFLKDKIKKETVREILQLIEYYDIEHPVLSRNDVFTIIANKYGIEM